MRPLTFAQGKQYVGIDLGTTYSAVAYLNSDGQPVTVGNAENQLITPSVVLFEEDGSVVVGEDARQAGSIDPDRVADCVKRDMGDAHYSRLINGRKLAPEAISALVIKKLIQDAEEKLGEIHGAVVTVPAYFDERRRQATVAAGQIAGLEVLDIINEPTAAALAYALRDFILKGGEAADELRLVGEKIPAHNAVVYDLGGGTFDVTLLSIVGKNVTVLATDGDVRLGGRDWDERIVDFASELFKQKHGVDPREDKVAHSGLLIAAENAKRQLTQRETARFSMTCGGKTEQLQITREKFQELTADLLYRTENRLTRVIKAAGMQWDHIDQVLTVGGSTRMQQVQAMLTRVTGREPNSTLAPDEVVAHGAAVHAAIMLLQGARSPKMQKPVAPAPQPGGDEEDLPLLDEWAAIESAAGRPGRKPSEQSPHEDLDVTVASTRSAQQPPAEAHESVGGDLAELPGGSEADMPILLDDTGGTGDAMADTMGATMADGDQPAEDPNEMTSVLRAVQTTNVNAHSLGVSMKREDGIFINSTVIPRNTPLPCSVTKRYGTSVPNQTSVTVRVVEGEAKVAEECIPIGECQVKQLPWGLRKGSTIYVTFSYDNSGRLDVKAVEATSGKSADTTINREGVMNDAQIQKTAGAMKQIKVK